MLLVASETGHVYTFATRKLMPIVTSNQGKSLIQTCLSTPDDCEGAATVVASLDDALDSTPECANNGDLVTSKKAKLSSSKRDSREVDDAKITFAAPEKGGNIGTSGSSNVVSTVKHNISTVTPAATLVCRTDIFSSFSSLRHSRVSCC